jgi:glycosyltransferase involved in cell wall biosynthesis
MFLQNLDDRAISRLTLRLSRELVALGAEVTLLVGRRDAMAPRHLARDVRFVDLRLGTRPTILGVPRLGRALARERLDVVFAHGGGPARAAIAARSIARVFTQVIVVEHVHYSTFYRTISRRRRWIRDVLTALLYPRACRIAAVSPGAVADLEARFPRLRGRTVVLPSAGPDPEEVRRLASAPIDDPWLNGSDLPMVVTSVSNLLPRKGQDVLVRALPAVRAAVGDVRLLLIGREDAPDFVAELRRSAQELGVAEHVRILGYREDPLPFVARSAVFAHAATTEGFGMAIVEAMACGVPVVATDCPTGPAYVLDRGRCGLLVPVGDHGAMADGIVRILRDRSLRAELVERGRERARMFSLASVAHDYLAVAQACRDRGADRPPVRTRPAPPPTD